MSTFNNNRRFIKKKYILNEKIPNAVPTTDGHGSVPTIFFETS